jgi:hypothetical protein
LDSRGRIWLAAPCPEEIQGDVEAGCEANKNTDENTNALLIS